MKKTAVILFNLGGPDSEEAIEPFLMNFFTDKNIIRLPKPFRWMLARLIAYKRSRKEARKSYGELGGKSPLLANSQEQASALESFLNTSDAGTYQCFVCMRYWHPMARDVVRRVRDWSPDEIILLPLYPQYSTTTTRSSYQEWKKACADENLDKPTRFVCCYPDEGGFIGASAALLREIYEKAELETGMQPRVLFSAHGLPESIVRDGDPYQSQCERSAAAMALATGIENLDWQICYQSRVGRQKWLGPSTEEALHKAARDNVPVVILPHAFTQEHVETLVEIEMEYRELSEHLGVPGFYRVPTVGTHPDFIKGLADMIALPTFREGVASCHGTRLCDPKFSQCAMQQFCCDGC